MMWCKRTKSIIQAGLKIAGIFGLGMTLSACGPGISVPGEERGIVKQHVTLEDSHPCAVVKMAVDEIIRKNSLAAWMLADPFLAPLIDDMVSKVDYFHYSTSQLTYTSEDAQGRSIQLSGLVIHPNAKPGKPLPALPILSIQHATQLVSGSAPSMDINSFQVELAGVMACSGYAVLMPDYEGFGVSKSRHPYVVAKPLVNSVIDLIRGVRDLDMRGFNWNSKLFLMGFSEGGFVTLAAAQEIQEHLSSEFKLTAVAPLEGPYDLSGIMRKVMMTDKNFVAPFFLPYALLGYHHAYGDPVFSPEFTMIDPYNKTIPPLFDGTHGMSEINAALPKVPQQMLTEVARDQMLSSSSMITGYLDKNNAYRWIPKMPLMLFHHVNDDIVPYENATVAKAYFNTAGATSVELTTLTFAAPLATILPVHVTGFAPVTMKGFLWIDKQNRL